MRLSESQVTQLAVANANNTAIGLGILRIGKRITPPRKIMTNRLRHSRRRRLDGISGGPGFGLGVSENTVLPDFRSVALVTRRRSKPEYLREIGVESFSIVLPDFRAGRTKGVDLEEPTQ